MYEGEWKQGRRTGDNSKMTWYESIKKTADGQEKKEGDVFIGKWIDGKIIEGKLTTYPDN